MIFKIPHIVCLSLCFASFSALSGPIHDVVRNGDARVLSEFLKSHPGQSVDDLENGETPMDIARKSENLTMLNLLIDHHNAQYTIQNPDTVQATFTRPDLIQLILTILADDYLNRFETFNLKDRIKALKSLNNPAQSFPQAHINRTWLSVYRRIIFPRLRERLELCFQPHILGPIVSSYVQELSRASQRRPLLGVINRGRQLPLVPSAKDCLATLEKMPITSDSTFIKRLMELDQNNAPDEIIQNLLDNGVTLASINELKLQNSEGVLRRRLIESVASFSVIASRILLCASPIYLMGSFGFPSLGNPASIYFDYQFLAEVSFACITYGSIFAFSAEFLDSLRDVWNRETDI